MNQKRKTEREKRERERERERSEGGKRLVDINRHNERDVIMR